MTGWHDGAGHGRPFTPGDFALIYREPDRQLAPADVQKIAEGFLLWNGNHSWKVTNVAATPDGAGHWWVLLRKSWALWQTPVIIAPADLARIQAPALVIAAGAAAVSTPLVAVLSGGNVDPLLLGHLIRHGLSGNGRYLNFHCVIPDRPGGLAHLLSELAASGANVLEVAHERTSTTLHIGDVEVALQLETRGPEHADAVMTRLRDHGYRIIE